MDGWAVLLMQYGAGVVKWTKYELEETGRETRKVTRINEKLHLKSYITRLYVPENRGRSDFVGCKICVINERNILGRYFIGQSESFIADVRIKQHNTYQKLEILPERLMKHDKDEGVKNCKYSMGNASEKLKEKAI